MMLRAMRQIQVEVLRQDDIVFGDHAVERLCGDVGRMGTPGINTDEKRFARERLDPVLRQARNKEGFVGLGRGLQNR